MKPAIRILLLICMMTIVSACNNDIFLDGPEMSDYSYAIVKGDGGTTSFSISTTGLLQIAFDLFAENQKYCTYGFMPAPCNAIHVRCHLPGRKRNLN